VLPPYTQQLRRHAKFGPLWSVIKPNSFIKGTAVLRLKDTEHEGVRETVEFNSLPVQQTDESTKETVDEKMVLELLGQLLLTASQAHRTFLEQQEQCVRELMQRIPDSPRLVESELTKVYQQIKASFSRLAEAIGDHP
jgi:hypothetical protein